MSDKLPEWPGKPMRGEGVVSVSFQHVAAVQAMWLTYNEAVAEAALARMEALMEYVEHYDSWTHGCATLGATSKAWTEGKRGCTCGLSELLAACDRP